MTSPSQYPQLCRTTRDRQVAGELSRTAVTPGLSPLEFRGVAITLDAPPSPDPGVIGVWLHVVQAERVSAPTPTAAQASR